LATISRINPRGILKYSVQLKYATSYIILIAAILAFMNIFPIVRIRDILFESKYMSMQNQTTVVASSMSAWTILYPEDVSKVMDLLDLDMTRLVIVDPDMKIVYDSFDNEGSVGKYALFSELSRALSGKDVFYSRYLNGALISKAAAPVTSGNKIIGALYIYDYETEQARLITALQNDLAKVSVFISVITAGLAFIFSKMLTDRIKSILKAIKNVKSGHYHYRASVKGKDELAELGNEFNTLVNRLQKTEDMRQRFVSDASHELKTPLAAIRLLTDSIVQNENMDKSTLREFIYDIGREADRLTRITEKLLNLTRIDNQAQSENTPIDMKRIIRQALTLLESLAEKRNITLEVQLGDKCVILANADDIYQVVFNIVENAIKYNHDNGSVTILLFVSG
jgi:signal transduction histidine kinase